MALHPVYGHEGVRDRLGVAAAAGRLPQALLFEGPPGVGKQRLALWLAQTLICESPGESPRPCGRCLACTRVLSLGHPDVLWLVPLEITRKGADADKQVELVEEALGEEMALRREQPLYRPPPGAASHGIAAVRLLARRLPLRPALARRKVVVIGGAERLVPQRANPEAANALLKTLEEPPPDTTIVLTTSDANALLPTIVSRLVRVRISRVPDSVVTEFAHRELGKQSSQLVAAAEGSIGRLLALEGGAPGASVERFLRAAGGGEVDRYATALGQPPYQARGGFTALLDGLLEHLRDRARGGHDLERVVAAIGRVLEARAAAQGNVNPQLLTAVLANELWGAP